MLVSENAEFRARIESLEQSRRDAPAGTPVSTGDVSLKVSELRYRRLFEAAQDGVILVDPDSRKIVDANPYIATLLGYTHAQLLGKELFEIGLLKDELTSQLMFSKLQSDHYVRYENLPLLSEAGGHQQVEVVANLYDEGGRSIIQCNIRDINARKRVEDQKQLLMAEVNHRSMNLLAVVQAVVFQTARGGDTESFVERLVERIQGLAASQDLLVRSAWLGVEVADLVVAQLAHFKDLIGTRIVSRGPSCRLTPEAAQGIGMALHELATNAGKYGALSNLAGKLQISWKLETSEPPAFSISWVETGGPEVSAPTRNGFGQMVIGRIVEAAVHGKAELDYRASGFIWKLTAPVTNSLQGRGRSNSSATALG